MITQRFAALEGFVRDIWRYKLTIEGKALVVAGVVASIFGYPLQLPILRTLATLFMLGFLAWLVNLFSRPRVKVSGAFPAKVSVGQTVTGLFVLSNVSRRTTRDTSAAFFGLDPILRPPKEPPYLADIVPGDEATLPVAVQPQRRGLYPLPPLRVFSTFPFNICRTGRKHSVGHSLLVLPSFPPVTSIDIPIGTRYQPGGIALTSDVGESPEYIGNREYQPGDPWHRLDFRSWARLARPVVREYQEEYYCRVALILDTFVSGRRRKPASGFPELEGAVSMAATVADALSRGEYIIDIFAAGPELYVFRAGRHTAHFENNLEIRACVEECRSDPFKVVAPVLVDELGNISSVVCVFLDWDKSREGLLQTALEAQCNAKVIIVRDGATTEPVEQVEALTGIPAIVLSPSEVVAGAFDRL